MKRRSVVTGLVAAFATVAFAQAGDNKKKRGAPAVKPDKLIDFKTVKDKKGGESSLKLHLYEAKGDKAAGKKRPCIVFFFGGGWSGGSPAQFYQQSAHFCKLGFVCISAQYRTKSSHNVDPDSCVEDGKSAIRWVRKYAHTARQKIVV